MKFYILGPIIIAIILFILFIIAIIQYKSFLISKKIKLYILIPLRIISIIILLILLLEPYFSYYDYSSKNKLNIYIDNSKSISYNNITSDSIGSMIQYFNNWSRDEEIEIKIFTFGDSVKLHSSNLFDLNDNSTNFFDLKPHIDKHSKTTNFIISDGNSTEGYNLPDLKFAYPINFIGLGFSNYEDVSIIDVKHNHSISIEDSLDIEFSVNSILKSGINSQLIISSDKTKIYEKNIELDEGKNKYNQSIKIPSNLLNSNFDIDIKNSLSTDNKFNNIYKGRVGIRDLKKEILLISGALSPNTKHIKDILYLIPNSSIKHIYRSKKEWTEEIEKIESEGYPLIVYDNFPLDNKDSNIMNYLLDPTNLNTKYIIFEGPSFSLNSFNQMDKELSVEIIENYEKSKFMLSGGSWPKSLPSTDRNFRVHNNQFKEIHLQYSDSSIAIAESDDYLFLSIPGLSSLCIKDLSDILEKNISEIIHKYMDAGNSIKLDIPNREIYTNQDLKFYLEFPDIYDYDNGNLSIHNIDLDLKYDIKLNKIKKDLDEIKYIENIKEGKNILVVNFSSDKKTYKSNHIELTVKKNNLESQKIYRNTEEMRDLAIKSNGNYYDIEEYNNIKPSILKGIREKNRKIELDIHSFDKYWFILLITLIIEWFFRKKKGLL